MSNIFNNNRFNKTYISTNNVISFNKDNNININNIDYTRHFPPANVE